ncbi:DUF5682 family protein [Capnocytophaga felis]|uniref:Uncharacterized protein n=1 Tax=Capnocytophaga felis TaxID=2267611 RepID=A0A5M4B5P3_9FLAO|nr:DUF5682 family protein [Capnocytophaga felis]GET44921.1 hypothetical protein RCZ01_02230 [Capnocytophaga felis]GET49373.1 hypothetical protein RCZ02_22040 [Capnocytophaga felis]
MNTFGVRHLSPGASFHLLKFLEKHKPKCILIEGPSDATNLITYIAEKGVKPPIAMLGYTTELPIETVLYPFASYSPEYQAICWGTKRKLDVRFIDLPSEIMLKLRQERNQEENDEKITNYYSFHNGLYDQLAKQYEETDYESYWERNFEHNLNEDIFHQGLGYQSEQIRELVIEKEYESVPYDFSYNLIRESYMKREIQKALTSYKPEEIVIIVGAYHLAGIHSDLPAMTDDELKKLPRATSQLTLMPYSYLRLSSRTGYGAGNKAPYYFELMWQTMQSNNLQNLSAVYLSKVAKELREKGDNASSASVIEAIRLANALTAMRGGTMPVLKDLHDAVITCFGGGELSPVAEAINRVDVGTAIGSLPEGISQTPVQENMNQELKRLKLTQYKSAVAQELTLDLRENLKVKTKEAAFIDLNRSIFLHRLRVLGILFAQEQRTSQDSATWAEKWILQWSPEVEIQIVEANLKGETIEIAAAFHLKELLNESDDISVVATIVRQACECHLTSLFENALSTLQRLLIDSNSFTEIANAAHELAVLVQYGNLRQFDLEPLKPILQQLFLRASLLLVDASSCDDKASTNVLQAINTMEFISQQQYDLVDVETWQKELSHLAWRDDLNARLSGVAFSILLEHNLASEEDCAKEVSRRLSPGIPADLGASWFEGLSGRNRYALLSRVSLWKELDLYVQQLDDDEFLRSVVFLRRAFADFEPNQKNSIAELLGDLWGTGSEATAEALQTELTEDETSKLDELNDFDFDF